MSDRRELNEREEYAAVTAGVIAHLYEDLGVEVGSETPADAEGNRPDVYIEVRRTGGGRVSPVTERAMVTVLVHAPSGADAEVWANKARASIGRMRVVDDHSVRGIADVGGPADTTDRDTGRPQWQFTVTLHLRINITEAP